MLSSAFVPLYFVAAWFMANRDLTDRLECHLSLRLRARVPAVWRYWIGDAVFSAIALPIALAASHQATLWLPFGQDRAQTLSLTVYPAAFVLLGLIWPKLSAITVGTGEGGSTLSVAALRDRFLGGPMIAAVNADVHRLLEDYLDRLAAAVCANPEIFATWVRRQLGSRWEDPEHPTPTELEQLRLLLSKAAAGDFEQLRQEASALEMIPFRMRSKPLMKVPGMTCADEQLLYEAGIRSVCRFYFARHCPRTMVPQRWEMLKNNVGELLWTRCKLSAAAVIVLVGVTGMSGAFFRAYRQPAPQARAASPSPQSDSIDQLRDSNAYSHPGGHR
jgi:hypothetical protein